MKFLVVYIALLLSSLLSVSFANREKTEEHWRTSRKQIVYREILFVEGSTEALTAEPIGSPDNHVYRLVAREKGKQRRKLTSRELQRKVEPADGASQILGHEIEFKMTVEDPDLTNLKLIFESGDTVIEIPAEPDNGVVDEILGGFPEGKYNWHLEGTKADGEIIRLNTKTMQVGPEIVRQSGSTLVKESAWEKTGQVQSATGRIYYYSPGSDADYACTGTAIRDNKSGRSIVLTAAHCVWDDIDESKCHSRRVGILRSDINFSHRHSDAPDAFPLLRLWCQCCLYPRP
jgi:hypothetical protein